MLSKYNGCHMDQTRHLWEAAHMSQVAMPSTPLKRVKPCWNIMSSKAAGVHSQIRIQRRNHQTSFMAWKQREAAPATSGQTPGCA